MLFAVCSLWPVRFELVLCLLPDAWLLCIWFAVCLLCLRFSLVFFLLSASLPLIYALFACLLNTPTSYLLRHLLARFSLRCACYVLLACSLPDVVLLPVFVAGIKGR